MSVGIHTIHLGYDQCYVLEGDGVIAIDAGQANRGKAFHRGLKRADIRPDEVKLLIPTHGHWDHIGSAAEIKSLTGAPIAMHRAEAHWLENSLTPLPPGVTPWGKFFHAIHTLFTPLIKVPATKVDLVLDDEGLNLADFGIPGRVVHTPGHSAGSVAVLLESGEAFVGDLAMNRMPLRLTPGLPILAEDPDLVLVSWKKLIAMGATMVYPAHGKPFPISVIEEAIAGLG